MVSIPPSKPSSTTASVDEFLETLAGPLVDRCRLGQPALGLAYYEGQELDLRWRGALEEWGKTRGLFIEHVSLGELGDCPVRRLLTRHRVTEHLFSVEIRSAELPDAALGQPTAVTDLNIHRDTFRDERLCLLIWVPRGRARRFLELASNLADYHTVDLDVPPFPDQAGARMARAGQLPTVLARHNLPIASIGEQFIGREEEMARLREMLLSSGRSAITDPLALEGLGGIGKTRLALEYAWQHLPDYEWVFFIRADTPETLRAGLAGLADREWLGIPEAAETAEETRLQAVLRWFANHDRWLLILDNADSERSAELIAQRLLSGLGRGHVLLTTRFRRWGRHVRALLLDPLPQSEAVRYLITATQGHRAPTPDDPESAAALTRAVDGLPLALEQIAAWTRARHSTLADALAAITREDDLLLRWYDPKELRYPLPVAAVWERALEPLGPAEHFLLRLLAWLAPAPVPDFVLHALNGTWTEPQRPAPDCLALARRLADHSLLAARADRSFQLHRLWMELERRRTPSSDRGLWDTRVANVLDEVTIGAPYDVRTWPRLTLLQPHAFELFRRTHAFSVESLAAAKALPSSPRLSRLLNQFGVFCRAKAEFAEAEPLMRRALAMDEKAIGPEHPDVARDLNNLALLLQDTNRLAEAEPLMRRALAMDEKSFGPEHPEVATDLNNLAALLKATNRLAEAEPLMRRALAMAEKSFGPEHPAVATALNNLAQLLKATNRLAEAEPLMRRALAMDEKAFGPEHPTVATDLNNLALLLQATNRLAEAEPLMRRALAMDEKSFGPEHPTVALRLNNLAQLLKDTNRLAEAEPLMRRALAMAEKAFGPEHPNVATALNNLAQLLKDTNRRAEAEPLMRRALAMDEKAFGPEHPTVATDLNNLAQLLQDTNRRAEAEPLMRRALGIFSRSLVPQHPSTQTVAGNYLGLLKAMGLPEDEIRRRVREAAGR